MPFLVLEIKGPSMCAPRDSEPSSGMRWAPDGPRCGSTYFAIRGDLLSRVKLVHVGRLLSYWM